MTLAILTLAAALLLAAPAATVPPAAPTPTGATTPTAAAVTPDASPAAPLTAPLRFRQVDSLNRHSTMGFSTSRRIRAEVVLVRNPDGTVRVEDTGERGHGSADAEWGYSGETTRWKTVWTGTWRETSGGAEIALKRSERTCATTVTRPRSADETVDCPASKSAVRLLCRTTRVRLGADFLDSDARGALHDVWECLPKPSDDGAGAGADALDSPSPWLFAADACVEATGAAHPPRRVRLCHDDEP